MDKIYFEDDANGWHVEVFMLNQKGQRINRITIKTLPGTPEYYEELGRAVMNVDKKPEAK